jgi:MFS family permease
MSDSRGGQRSYLELARLGTFRNLALGAFVSDLGDGMAIVAVPWLALHVAGSTSPALAVGLALAATYAPAVPVGLLLGWIGRDVPARTAVALDCALHGGLLTVVALLAWAGRLELATYVVLLACSALFRTLGLGGRRTLVAALVDPDRRFPANSLVSTLQQFAGLIVGPALGGIGTAVLGANAVLLIDGLSFAALLLAVLAIPAERTASSRARGARVTALGTVLAYPRVAAVLLVAFVFYAAYGPFEVAVPLQVRGQLHGDAALLGQLWTVLGVGAVASGMLAGLVRRVPMRALIVAIMLGWGLAADVFAFATSPAPALIGFAAGGVAWGPYLAVVTTILQNEVRAEHVASVNLSWASMTFVAAPLGVVAASPLVAWLGAPGTLRLSALVTVALALATIVPEILLRRTGSGPAHETVWAESGAE